MPEDSCPERIALSKSVVTAITESYRAKAAYDTAKEKRAGNVDALSLVLLQASAAARVAERALQQHW